MRVAAAQFATTLDREANLRAAAGWVRAAASGGARLVVLPEATMCSFGPAGTDLTRLAEPLDGPFVRQLVRTAGETGTVVVAGTLEPSAFSGRVHNTVVVVDGGGLLAAYRKIHLYDALGWRESERVAAGDPAGEPVVVGRDGLRLGIMNCYDLRFPEMARVLVDRGATVLLVPANWIDGPGKADAWQILCRARAIESTSYVVAAAKPGPDCSGRSMIVDPSGAVLASAGASEEGLVRAEASAAVVTAVRRAMPVLEHRRFAVEPGSPTVRTGMMGK